MANIFRTAANKIVRRSSRLFEVLGYQVVASNYNSPIPRSFELSDSLFSSISECVGINWNVPTQEKYLSQVFSEYSNEVEFYDNPWISPIDAVILHSMIRHHKPRKMVEIGSGYSTEIAAAAISKNNAGGFKSELVAIDPDPRSHIRADIPGLTKFIRSPVQDVPLEDIVDCDLLFIDSTHIVKMGGDVNYEILEILPRLKANAIVHFHDILLPGEYWKDWVTLDHNFWTEQYLLEAFLQFNSAFEIIWASRFMSMNRTDAVQSAFPGFKSGESRISSFWIRRNA